ncbi:MAG: GTP cyclohydrolase II, partial [Gammaproteobacteria bacterium]
AVSMLAQLGVTRVRLLTNNPHKMQALVDGGVDVVERMPLIAAVNPHNRPYLEAKAERSGHMLPLLDE